MNILETYKTLTPQEKCFRGNVHLTNDSLYTIISFLNPEDQTHLSSVTKKCHDTVAEWRANNREEGPVATLSDELICHIFTFLDLESWENVSKVCYLWNTWMMDVKWSDSKKDPLISSYIQLLTHLVEQPLVASFPLQKQLLENTCNRLLKRNELQQPESLTEILTYKIQVEREIAEICQQMMGKSAGTDNDVDPMLRAIHAAYKACKACNGKEPYKTIIEIVGSLGLLLASLNAEPETMFTNEIIHNRSLRMAFASGHGKEAMKFLSAHPKFHPTRDFGRAWAKETMRPLIRLGRFSNVFSLIQKCTSLNLVKNKHELLNKTFCQVCIEEGCIATADTAFRRFVSEEFFEPKTQKRLAKSLAMAYLSRGELEKAKPLIEEYQFHLDLGVLKKGVQKLVNAGHLKEACSLISMRQESNLLPYQKSTDQLLSSVIQKCVKQEDLEATESFIRSNYTGIVLHNLLLEIANKYTEKAVDKKTKAVELLMECAIAYKDDDRIVNICTALLRLQRGDLAITLMEQNSQWIYPTFYQGFLPLFVEDFAEINQEILLKDPSLREQWTETTQRLINIVIWLQQGENRRYSSEFDHMRRLLIDSIRVPNLSKGYSSSSSSD